MKAIDQSLLHELFDTLATKAQRTQMAILEAAIKNYSKVGVDETTYEKIAKTCKVSRPLIQHYFPDQHELFTLTMKYIRAKFQQISVEAIREEMSPDKQLEAYVRSNFSWAQRFRAHANVWLLFYHYCGVHPKFRELNTTFVRMGHERIQGLLELGIQRKVFACKDPYMNAKLIQIIITGALVSICTDNSPIPVPKFQEEIVKLCLELANRH